MANIATRPRSTLVEADGTGSSAAAAVEQLVGSAQGVITKRIDLALLEGRELVSVTLDRAAWGAIGVILATVTWLSLAATLVFLLLPDAVPGVQLAVFALMNGVAATGALSHAARSKRRAGPRTISTIEENS